MLYKSDKGKAACHELAAAAQRLGLDSREMSDGEITQLDPHIETSANGVYFSQDAHIEPNRFVQFLSRHIQKRGAEIHTDTEVTGFQTGGDAIKTVRTTRGDFTAETVVLAGGSGAPQILRNLRLTLPMQPAKGYSITFKNAQPMPEIPMLCTEAKVAVTPFGDRLRYGGTLELAGLDLSIDQRRVNAILKAVPEYLPQMAANTLEGAEVWSGLRPCTPDGLPYLGRFKKWPNLIAATGHAMIGISLAPITGKLVAEIVLNQKPAIDIRALSVERFS
jgi:D-amino-acid dehydrogenase